MNYKYSMCFNQNRVQLSKYIMDMMMIPHIYFFIIPHKYQYDEIIVASESMYKGHVNIPWVWGGGAISNS